MRNIDILKQVLKKTAREIKGTRYQFKEAQRNRTGSWKLLGELQKLRYEYRHHHIAYCELRGRTRDEIETLPTNPDKEYNAPNDAYIEQIKEKYDWSEEEIARYEERKAMKKGRLLTNEAVYSK